MVLFFKKVVNKRLHVEDMKYERIPETRW